jgi:hypothetical protein
VIQANVARLTATFEVSGNFTLAFAGEFDSGTAMELLIENVNPVLIFVQMSVIMKLPLFSSYVEPDTTTLQPV